MNVKELRQLIKKLPPDMQVLIDIGDGSMVVLCHQSCVEEVVIVPKELENELEPIDEDTLEKESVLILRQCRCQQPAIGEINSQPQLN